MDEKQITKIIKENAYEQVFDGIKFLVVSSSVLGTTSSLRCELHNGREHAIKDMIEVAIEKYEDYKK